MTGPPPEIEAYLAGHPEEVRAALDHLRRMIAAAAPEAEEGISYSLPAFRYRGHPLVSYGATKRHCSFYVMSTEVMDSIADDVAGYDTAKGTIRFQPQEPLPEPLVRKVVAARLAETDTRWKP